MALDFYNRFFAITPSDVADLSGDDAKLTAIVVGGAGNLVAVTPEGVAVTFAVTAGQVLPIRCRRVNATNTTATGLVGLRLV